ncbi:hypothetical protein K438DRAFT_1955453 [Mycena galopus ATCC 62051]|nr:hypothetical protein K438DRAFT_1955453 [Mycena galopus ATCC 62051]
MANIHIQRWIPNCILQRLYLTSPFQRCEFARRIHEHGTLPDDLDTSKPSIEVFFGWILGPLQQNILLEWTKANHPHRVYRRMDGTPVVAATAYAAAEPFARAHVVLGGAAPVIKVGEHGEKPSAVTMIWVDSNNIVPEDRYTKEQWSDLAAALQVTEEPQCKFITSRSCSFPGSLRTAAAAAGGASTAQTTFALRHQSEKHATKRVGRSLPLAGGMRRRMPNAHPLRQRERHREEEVVGPRWDEGPVERYWSSSSPSLTPPPADLPLTPSATPLFPPSPAARVLQAPILVVSRRAASVVQLALHSARGQGRLEGVGMWFGPSTVASALKVRLSSFPPSLPFSTYPRLLTHSSSPSFFLSSSLVDAFRSCGMGMCVATDGTLYQSEVYATSCSPEALTRVRPGTSTRGGHSTKTAAGVMPETRARGDHPVLLLLGALHLPPVRRPSSSYYFVGVQGDGLFYLDLYYERPAVPLHLVTHGEEAPRRSLSPEASMSPEVECERGVAKSRAAPRGSMSLDSAPRRRASARAAAAAANSSTSTDVTPAGGHLSAAEEALYARAYLVAELRSTTLNPPSWGGMDDDDDMELESLLDPEKAADADIDDGGDMSSASPADSSGFHSCAGSTTRSKSTTSSSSARSEVDTEGNPVAPITPLPGSCFDLSRAPMLMKTTMSGDTNADAKGFVDASDEVDIEEDRVDPLSCPRRCRRPRKSPRPRAKESARARWRCRRPSPACTTCPRCRRRTKGCPLHLHRGTNGTGTGTLRFCRVGGGATNASAAASGSQRVHTTRARDGGRTQSGGVHGMLTEDQ